MAFKRDAKMKSAKRKLIKRALIIVFLGIALAVVIQFFIFLALFQNQKTIEKQLEIVEFPDRDYSLQVFYNEGGTLIPGGIQVRKVFNSGQFEVVESFLGYKYFYGLNVDVENRIEIVLSRRPKSNFQSPDTFYISSSDFFNN